MQDCAGLIHAKLPHDQPSQIGALLTEFASEGTPAWTRICTVGHARKNPGAHIRSASTTSENAGEGCRRLG